jgi:hypothetical protein
MQDIADGRVQTLAYAKYLFMLAATTLQQWLVRPRIETNGKKTDEGSTVGSAQKLGKRAIRLMTGIGLLDLVSYLLHCVGRHRSLLLATHLCSDYINSRHCSHASAYKI